jgi:hypothetical protein
MANRWLTQGKRLGQVAHTGFSIVAGVDIADQLQASWVGDRLEKSCKLFGLRALDARTEPIGCAR